MLRRGLISYWKRLFKEAGLDWTRAEQYVGDRKSWKKRIATRKEELRNWEDLMRNCHKNDKKPPRIHAPTTPSLQCSYPECVFVARSKTGLVQHERRKHSQQKLNQNFKCEKCSRSFATKSSLTNHRKACLNVKTTRVGKRTTCTICKVEISASNLSRHIKPNTHPIGGNTVKAQKPNGHFNPNSNILFLTS